MTDQGTVRPALVDAGLVVVFTIAAHSLVSAIPALARGVSPLQLVTLPLGSLSEWGLWLVYAGLVALLVLPRNRVSRGTRLWLSVAAAVVAWPLSVLLRPGIGSGAVVFLLWGIPWLLIVVASSVAAVLVVSRIRVPAAVDAAGPPPVPVEPIPDPDASPLPPPARRRSVLGILGGVVLALAVLLVASFPMQWFGAYFALFGGVREVTSEQVTVYLVSFVAAVLLAVTGLVLPIVDRRPAGITGPIVVLLLVLLVGFVCQVPQGSVWIEPGPAVEGPAPGEPGGGIREECAWDASRPGCGG